MKTRKEWMMLFICLIASLNMYAGDKASFLKKQFTASSGYQLNYRILYPLDYSPEKQYPVILFLHGAGERGHDNEAQLRHGGDMFASYETQSRYPAIIIAPQCPEGETWSPYIHPSKNNGKRFFPYNAPATPAMKAVKEMVDTYIAKGIVDTKRIYITGLSMGGMGTFDAVLRYPNFFAAASPICGGTNLQRLENFKGKTAFSIYHGTDDDTVNPQWSRDAYATLQKIKADVRYKEYPGVKHNSWDNAFAEPDYLGWMFQHTNPATPHAIKASPNRK